MSESVINRYHGLDFCRATFMLLGVFLHVGFIYSEERNWLVYSELSINNIEFLLHFIKGFRMEAFYFISGFFYFLLFSKGRSGFLKDRIVRAFIPLVFCGFFINPVMNYFSYNRVFSSGFDFFVQGEWLGHLWFLGNLILYFLFSYVLGRYVSCISLNRKFLFFILFCFILPVFSGVGLLLLKFFAIDTYVVFFSFNLLFYYLVYFVFGGICFYNRESFLSFIDYRCFFFSFFVFILIKYFMPGFLFESEFLDRILDRVSTGSLVLAMISLTYTLGCSGSKLIASISNSSYTIYLLHQPLIVVLYVFVFDVIVMPPLIEYFFLVGIVFILSYWVHVFLVKDNKVLLFCLNGIVKKRKINEG